MNILALADKESRFFWDFYQPGKLEKVDLILSCGDLRAEYLDFITTFAKCPVLYVHGNHDTRYTTRAPEGSVCIDDTIYVHNGVRILGLGGSMQYNGGPPFQYTELQMRNRFMRLWLQIKRYRGFDILLTHAPALGLGDGKDRVHRGFEIFTQMLMRYHPRYHLYGHIHAEYGKEFIRRQTFMHTEVINCYEKYLLHYETGKDIFASVYSPKPFPSATNFSDFL
jgi:predicted phosphodiesterase